ncbi:TonB-dependent receptor domain-containing protein [Qipengyuania sp.]|uniref:TonB-dependent receptor n=1 Tax=Qipengyuania sp. TaxID=2004515 RepID=UPI0035C871CB
MKIKYLLAASVVSLSATTIVNPTPLMAQETSSAIRGQVATDDGAPVAGAIVTAVHQPSGTTAQAQTDASGNFALNGLRIGGPFEVTVDAPTYELTTVSDIFLQAGQPLRLPIVVREANVIVVTGSAIQTRLSAADGPTTLLTSEDIDNTASLNRDIRDLARRDPLVSLDLTNSRAIEIAGNNGRLNRFSVDGIQLSDDFGLNNGGLPTNRGPVPFDAIDQFTVKVAPYDISEGDLQGGAINVVLKSGGNRFHGGGFYSYTGDGLTGNTSRGNTTSLDFSSDQYGGWVTGPIVPDRLFFMAAYERTKESSPFDNGFGPGFGNQVPGLTQGVIDSVTATAQSKYGYDTLGFIANANEEDEKFTAKIDLNISDDHRASLTYIRNVGTNQFQQNTFINAPFALGYQSNGYELNEEINSGAFELNSTWSNTFSTTLRASYRDYNRDQTPFGGRDFPQFEVCTDGASAGSATSCNGTRLFFGPDVSRQSNQLNTENLSIDLTARAEFGDAQIKFLAGYTKVDVFNLFLQRSLGDFYFDSLADYQAGRANRLRYANAVPSNDPNDAAAEFSTENYTVGVQGEWQLSDRLQLIAGVRYDLFDNNVLPPLNANFLARNGFSNRETFKGRGLFQPRAAFNLEATDRLVIRGGIGIFGGGTPDVFLSNVYSNTGQLTNAVDITRANCAANGLCSVLDNVTGAIPASVVNFLTTNTASLAAAPTDAIDPDLDIANKMKASLSADYEADLGFLGDGWLFGVQFLYDKTVDAYVWTDLRSVQIGTLPDGRPKYGPQGGAATTNRDLLLTNTSDGRGYFGTVRFAKDWDFGLGIFGSYTRSDVKDRASLTSSTSSSNYGNNAFVDPNFPEYGRSIYEFRDQYKFGMNFNRAFFGEANTNIGLFGEYRSGRPYSTTMLDNSGGRGAVFGTVGNLGNMLLYVPTGANDPLVSFDSAASQAAFENLVSELGLEKYRGSIVPKNDQTSPDFFKVDLHFGQEVPLPSVLGSRPNLELFADIENVLNLIDSDWGALRQVQFPYNAAVVRVACLATATPTGTAATANSSSSQPCAQYRYSNVLSPNEAPQVRQSLYGVRVGVRLKF